MMKRTKLADRSLPVYSVGEEIANTATHLLGGLLGVGLLVSLWPNNTIQKMEDFRPKRGTAILCGVLLVWAILSFSSVATFIYSNF